MTVPDEVANAELRALYGCRDGAERALAAHRGRIEGHEREIRDFAGLCSRDASHAHYFAFAPDGQPIPGIGPDDGDLASSVAELVAHVRRLDDLVKDLAYEKACAEELAQILGEGA